MRTSSGKTNGMTGNHVIILPDDTLQIKQLTLAAKTNIGNAQCIGFVDLENGVQTSYDSNTNRSTDGKCLVLMENGVKKLEASVPANGFDTVGEFNLNVTTGSANIDIIVTAVGV